MASSAASGAGDATSRESRDGYDVWIEIEFDERWFPEPVWDALYLNAKALRYILEGAVERVSVAARSGTVQGSDERLIEFFVGLSLRGERVQRTIEFGPHGYWRLERALDAGGTAGAILAGGAPFNVFRPDARFEFDRDLINRPELRLDILYDQLLAWLSELDAARPDLADLTGPILKRLRDSAALSERVSRRPPRR